MTADATLINDSLGNSVRVVIVDDHPVFAVAMQERLSAEADIEVVATAADGHSARAAVATQQPDVVTLDILLGDDDGLAVGRQLHDIAPGVSLIAVTCMNDPQLAADAVRAGVQAWVPKDAGVELLLAAVRGAPHGDSWFPPALLGQMLPLLRSNDAPNRHDTRLAGLTDRQRQILECMAEGLGRRAIADRLQLSVNTVRTHVQAVLAKLQVHTSLEAVALALSAELQDDVSEHPGMDVGS